MTTKGDHYSGARSIRVSHTRRCTNRITVGAPELFRTACRAARLQSALRAGMLIIVHNPLRRD
uniref:Uncharacterized protein n=1 Tax=Romanomermis culicivorax TaxID=13658 RepID=A0A915I1R4_ROMCU